MDLLNMSFKFQFKKKNKMLAYHRETEDLSFFFKIIGWRYGSLFHPYPASLTRTITWKSFKLLFPTKSSQHFYVAWLSDLSLKYSFNITEPFEKMLNIFYPWRYSIFWWNKQDLKIFTSLKNAVLSLSSMQKKKKRFYLT